MRQIRECIELGRPLPRELREPLCNHLEASLEREQRTSAALAKANEERRELVHAGVHLAADRFLPALIARGALRRSWTGALREYLERRYALVGLERWPCRRAVHEALKKWTPPNGDARKAAYCHDDNRRQHGGSEAATETSGR